MRKFITLTAAALLAGLAQAAETVTCKVNGLVCDFCAQSLNETFGKMAEVEKIDVSLEKATVTVFMKPGQTVDDAGIRKAIEYGGYDVVSIERTGTP